MPVVDRNELETLDRNQLIERARSVGIERPEVLTRLELLDEILSVGIADEQERRKARGLLGKARDLVAKVVEKGLNLPDAAQRLRTLAPPLAAWRRGPPPLATISLAEIYAGQGHDKLALKVIDEVLEREPEHAYAQQLRDRIRQQQLSPTASPVIPAPRPVHLHLFDSAETVRQEPAPVPIQVERIPAVEPGPAKVVEVPVDDGVEIEVRADVVGLSWRLRPRSFARARAMDPKGRLVLRLLFAQPSWEGARLQLEDVAVDALRGELRCPLPEGTRECCAALGWLSEDGFQALATTTALRTTEL